MPPSYLNWMFRIFQSLGVCHILREYWEALPPQTTRQILSYVVGTLGHDSNCGTVRLAVVTGLGERSRSIDTDKYCRRSRYSTLHRVAHLSKDFAHHYIATRTLNRHISYLL